MQLLHPPHIFLVKKCPQAHYGGGELTVKKNVAGVTLEQNQKPWPPGTQARQEGYQDGQKPASFVRAETTYLG